MCYYLCEFLIISEDDKTETAKTYGEILNAVILKKIKAKSKCPLRFKFL